MKKILSFFLLIFITISINAQTGLLPYQSINQIYRGNSFLSSFLNDSLIFQTSKKYFTFNKPIYLNGMYLLKITSADTSYWNHKLDCKAETDPVFLLSPSSSITNDNIVYWNAKLSSFTEIDPIFKASPAFGITNDLITYWNAAYDLRHGPVVLGTQTNGLYLSGQQLTLDTVTNNTSGAMTWYLRNKFISSLNSIPSQLKNYNPLQDTVIRFPNLASNKYGIYQNINNGISYRINSNNYTAWSIDTINSSGVGWQINRNIGIGWKLNNNLATHIGWDIETNDGLGFYINNNTSNGNGWFLGTNLGTGWNLSSNSGNGWWLQTNNTSGIGWNIGINNGNAMMIGYNNNDGISIFNTNGSGHYGIKSFAADSVSSTSSALTASFGKTASHLDIDGFGNLNYFSGLKKRISFNPHISNKTNLTAYLFDTDTVLNVANGNLFDFRNANISRFAYSSDGWLNLEGQGFVKKGTAGGSVAGDSYWNIPGQVVINSNTQDGSSYSALSVTTGTTMGVSVDDWVSWGDNNASLLNLHRSVYNSNSATGDFIHIMDNSNPGATGSLSGSILSAFLSDPGSLTTVLRVSLNPRATGVVTPYYLSSQNAVTNHLFEVAQQGRIKFSVDTTGYVNAAGFKVNGVSISTGGGIPSQLKNYNVSQDTVIRFPDISTNKFCIWQNFNNGYGWYTNTISTGGFGRWVGENSGIDDYLSTNLYGASMGRISANNGYGWYIDSNSSIGTGWYLDVNNGKAFYINQNNKFGYVVLGTNGSGNYGIKSFAADSVSTTSGALTATLGKSSSHLDIDGFGKSILVQTTVPTVALGTGAGTGASYSLMAGSNDRAGQITITTGTSSTTSATFFTITFANPYKSNVFVVFQPANANAAAIQYYSNTNSSSYISLSPLTITDSKTYVWNYIVQQ